MDTDAKASRASGQVPVSGGVGYEDVLSELLLSKTPYFEKIVTMTLMKRAGNFQMMVPPRFVREHGDNLEEVITLIDPTGNVTWSANLTVFQKSRWYHGVSLTGLGWRQFFIMNRLTAGDKIVFSLVAMSMLVVYVFPKSGNVENHHSCLSAKTSFKRARNYCRPTERPNDIARSKMRTTNTADNMQNCTSSSPYVHKKRGTNRETYQVENSNINTRQGQERVPKIKKGVKKTATARRPFLSQKPVTEVDSQGKGAGLPFPQFVKTLTDTCFHSFNGSGAGARMFLPSSFAHANYDTIKDGVKLEGPSGSVHDVKCVEYNSSTSRGHYMRLCFTAGWRAFVVDNAFRKGDTICFSMCGLCRFLVQVVES